MTRLSRGEKVKSHPRVQFGIEMNVISDEDFGGIQASFIFEFHKLSARTTAANKRNGVPRNIS